MKLVLDASVAIKWLIPEEYSQVALELLKRFAEGVVELHAPLILKYEVYNALKTYVSRKIITAENAYRLSSIFSQIELSYHEPSWKILQTSLKQALEYGITVYDAIYITLAQELDATLITADKHLIEKITNMNIKVAYLPQLNT